MYKKYNECKQRKTLDENYNQLCYDIKTIPEHKSSGSKVIDDFIRYTQRNYIRGEGRMEFVPYDRFKNIEFIAEGGFSKIYKAIWVDGPITNWHGIERNTYKIVRSLNYTVVLKKLKNSKNVTSKERNELKIFHQICSNKNSEMVFISKYFGITRDPITKEIMIIMSYYNSGYLMHYISNNFYNISWYIKLTVLRNIIIGLKYIHDAKIIHRDLHSGNIFIDEHNRSYIGDLGISKSAIEFTNNDNENYGIIPYMAPEIFRGQKYNETSDIYSFGMIMWEFMIGRRPFWDQNHDTDLIIDICDGLRPSIVTNAPESYIEVMIECWHPFPKKRPPATDIFNKITKMWINEYQNPTKIIKSSDIGPVTSGAIYKSRPLSSMIKTTMSLRSSRSQFTNLEIGSKQSL
ncbi:hypothetical protein RclHR1_07180003 [Rhizophagus clarus]|uniref:Kinase-like domain-containing protein n=1 Tax=Rhizophagus clarus TaxID=94130 RepID=A0A2Z6RV35_9GLOM|nr:hypothetical protein RclHR1_07180003 [Rhizophagus clarus]GES87849.1 kinase-like domain-containing protein [Rhizophagus clarus]